MPIIRKKVLQHADIAPLLDRIATEPEFQCGACNSALPQFYRPTGQEWYRRKVTLEFPLGQLGYGLLDRMALIGKATPKTLPIDGTERFNAQGIEGKCAVEMDLFGALMKMRDLLPKWRGRIVID